MAEIAGFRGIAGHVAWKSYFERAVATQQLAHAYIFSGPESVGKFTFAKAAAAILICKNKSDARPCGKCDGCARFAADTHPDVAVIDAVAAGARGLGVEEARDRVVDAFRLKPHDAPLRIVIINDADRMEAAAQNAILKTLEEPPARSLLILVARDASLLLETVVSRCFLLRFAAVPAAEFAQWLADTGRPSAEIAKLTAIADGVPGRALELATEAGSLLELARACLSGAREPHKIGKEIAEFAAEMSEKSAFERRRKASFAFCAALAGAAREAFSTGVEPDDLLLSARLERIAAASAELAASVTPELATDRLMLDVAPARARRPGGDYNSQPARAR
ncbi:MAG: DNA polymerase III subunit delta' [Planctomycetes bacterium]|nr:DNA polymerase III subunit delta' [Planctomycetota bacterium]